MLLHGDATTLVGQPMVNRAAIQVASVVVAALLVGSSASFLDVPQWNEGDIEKVTDAVGDVKKLPRLTSREPLMEGLMNKVMLAASKPSKGSFAWKPSDLAEEWREGAVEPARAPPSSIGSSDSINAAAVDQTHGVSKLFRSHHTPSKRLIVKQAANTNTAVLAAAQNKANADRTAFEAYLTTPAGHSWLKSPAGIFETLLQPCPPPNSHRRTAP